MLIKFLTKGEFRPALFRPALFRPALFRPALLMPFLIEFSAQLNKSTDSRFKELFLDVLWIEGW